MSQVFTTHEVDFEQKCPKCEEKLYIVMPGLIKCILCDYTDEGE